MGFEEPLLKSLLSLEDPIGLRRLLAVHALRRVFDPPYKPSASSYKSMAIPLSFNPLFSVQRVATR
jgi:hypothetical protein